MHLIGTQVGHPQVLQPLLLLVFVLLHLEQMVEVGKPLLLDSVFLIFRILFCNVARTFRFNEKVYFLPPNHLLLVQCENFKIMYNGRFGSYSFLPLWCRGLKNNVWQDEY